MEMPVDIIGKHLNAEQEHPLTNSQLAMNIDLELQRKFVFIPYEEINAVEIDTNPSGLHHFQAGSGPETIRAHKDDNPNWLYNSAVHALAMWQHLDREQEKAKVPDPGVYLVTNRTSNISFTAIVTQDRRIKVVSRDTGIMTDQTESMRNSNSEFVWSVIDTATGAVGA